MNIKKAILNELENFKSHYRRAILPTILVTAIFFVTLHFFGIENTMIGTFETLAFLRVRTMRNHYACMAKNFIIFLAMAPIAMLTGINLAACITVNALALFWIAYFLIDEYHPDNYFPAGMALILFQTTPVDTLSALGNRMLAVTVAFVLVITVMFVFSKIVKYKDPIPEYIRQGFENCGRQLDLCGKRLAEGSRASVAKSMGEIDQPSNAAASGEADVSGKEKLKSLHTALIKLNIQLSNEIYASNRAEILPKGKTNWYCRFVLFFQVINYLTLHCADGENFTKAQKLYADFKYQFEHTTPASGYHRLHLRLPGPDIRSFRLRFALRQIITIIPCLIFVRASGLPNVNWLIISVFFMMIPFTDHTMKRVRQRIYGTMVGVVASLVLYTIFTSFPARMAIMTVANYFIYASTGYGFTSAYITCSALAVKAVEGAVGMVLFQRLVYTIIGGAIALIANRLIFPIRTRRQIDYLTDRLDGLRKKMDTSASADEDEGLHESRMDELIIQSYILTKGVQSMSQSLPEAGPDFDYDAFETKHVEFIEKYLTKEFLRKVR